MSPDAAPDGYPGLPKGIDYPDLFQAPVIWASFFQ